MIKLIWRNKKQVIYRYIQSIGKRFLQWFTLINVLETRFVNSNEKNKFGSDLKFKKTNLWTVSFFKYNFNCQKNIIHLFQLVLQWVLWMKRTLHFCARVFKEMNSCNKIIEVSHIKKCSEYWNKWMKKFRMDSTTTSVMLRLREPVGGSREFFLGGAWILGEMWCAEGFMVEVMNTFEKKWHSIQVRQQKFLWITYTSQNLIVKDVYIISVSEVFKQWLPVCISRKCRNKDLVFKSFLWTDHNLLSESVARRVTPALTCSYTVKASAVWSAAFKMAGVAPL